MINNSINSIDLIGVEIYNYNVDKDGKIMVEENENIVEEKKERISFVKKRKKELILTGIALIIVVGITFAWLTQTLNSNNKNVLLSGNLVLTLLNEDPIIKAGGENGYAIPMDDAHGLATTPYTFTVKNNGNVDASYNISLTNSESYTETVAVTDAYGNQVTDNYGYPSYQNIERQVYYDSQRIADNLIKYNIREGSDTNTTTSLLSSTTDRVFISGTLAPGETKTYYLRLWISQDAEKTDIVNKVFAANLKIDAIQYGGGAYQSSQSSARNSHIKAIYEYSESGSGLGASFTGCLGGAESGCVDVKNSYTSSSTYAVGTIIKYEVKDGVEKYFNVLHDDGDTLTLQERQNTVTYIAWGDSNGIGLTGGYALYELEEATADWTNVNTQSYSIGNSSSTLGYSGCEYNNCSTATYTLTRTGVKARMITVPELAALNCTQEARSCKPFVYNYLRGVDASGQYYDSMVGTFATDVNDVYWTMSSGTNSIVHAWLVHGYGYIYADETDWSDVGARAVIVIDK